MNDWYLGNIAGFILNEKLWVKFTSFFQVALSLKFWKKSPLLKKKKLLTVRLYEVH